MDLCQQYNARHMNVWQALYDLVNECRKAAGKRGRPYIKNDGLCIRRAISSLNTVWRITVQTGKCSVLR
jgi:hypothetical protein